jgi:hypothetical protein
MRNLQQVGKVMEEMVQLLLLLVGVMEQQWYQNWDPNIDKHCSIGC